MSNAFRLEGFDEAIAAFDQLKPPTQRNALMRVLRTEIKPLADAVIAGAPYKYGDLKANYFTGTRLTRRQRGFNFGERKATAELHFGTADPAGFLSEFGLSDNPMKPHFRPEWEARKVSIRDGIGRTLGDSIMKAAARAGRKAARLKARGG